MDGNAIPVGENITIIVKASGDLFLEGQDLNEVRFQSNEERIRVNQSNETLFIETHANMELAVPHRAKIVVEKVGGSAFLQDIDGSLSIQKVGGDLAMQRMGTVRIEKVGGNCMIKTIGAGSNIHKVGGDLTLRDAGGTFEVGMIGGNGDLQMVRIDAVDARAGGDLRIYVTESIAGRVGLRAGGDVEIFLPANASGRFILMSSGETIGLDLPRQAQPVQTTVDARRHEFSLGEGDGLVEAQAGGDIRVTDEAIEPQSISEELERREEAWKESYERRSGASWSGGFGFDRTTAWADMISRRAQEAARRAEQRAQSAMRRTEEQIRRAAERDINWPVDFSVPSAPPPYSPPQVSDPVSEEERLVVLKMLQEQKITIEQAEQLLAALEGRQKS